MHYFAKIIDEAMKAVIQRVSEANVTIEGMAKGKIGQGLLVLLGIGKEDTQEDALWLGKKICQLRIFNDQEDKMNLSVKEVKGEILLISQFTLHAATKKGNRPAFTDAAQASLAIPLYEYMIQLLDNELPGKIQTGTFGADMKVSLTNDGPVTIVIDTQNKH